jgi:hypothetical protein
VSQQRAAAGQCKLLELGMGRLAGGVRPLKKNPLHKYPLDKTELPPSAPIVFHYSFGEPLPPRHLFFVKQKWQKNLRLKNSTIKKIKGALDS